MSELIRIRAEQAAIAECYAAGDRSRGLLLGMSDWVAEEVLVMDEELASLSVDESQRWPG